MPNSGENYKELVTKIIRRRYSIARNWNKQFLKAVMIESSIYSPFQNRRESVDLFIKNHLIFHKNFDDNTSAEKSEE